MTAPLYTPDLWTPELVKARLAEAADTLRRLPSARIRARLTAWPDVVQSAATAYGYEAARTRPAAPSPEAISRMDETLGWLFWVENDGRRLLWARAMGVPWRRLEDLDGRSHVTLKRAHDRLLDEIARRLNGK
ncbi:DUF6362 family protein [Oceanibaculum nanhaiense]|uniref:DUF6362 family protein n=1 Tax=Oceanibaculum nanhaiense TaxID=1909734 RepID=UPI000A371289|nr:DUF6362 family protein [Oceanibaculum nanhaiense]MBC7134897.1 helix-turn-helix domain-containing protein [Oceanibaculum nanhaiense]